MLVAFCLDKEGKRKNSVMLDMVPKNNPRRRLFTMTRFDGDGFRGKRQNKERCGECSKIKQTNSRRGGWGEPARSVWYLFLFVFCFFFFGY